MTIFLDLDGTLLDVSSRYYAVYRDLLNEFDLTGLSRDEYWAAKRKKISEERILSLTGAQKCFELYRKRWLVLIEHPDYLNLDGPQAGAVQTLEKIAEINRPVLVTLRKSRPNLWRQLSDFGLLDYFSEIINSSAADDIGPAKLRLLEKYLTRTRQKGHVLVTDTDGDILAGKRLGCLTIAVWNGMRTRELLIEARPDHLIGSIGDLFDLPIDFSLLSRESP
ncbi:MAG: HAD family hydrolase [Thermodesulfobacteriota bacterium]